MSNNLFLGGRLVLHVLRKHTKGTQMQGVKVARPAQFKKLHTCNRTVSRAYGGNLTAGEVKDRIMRAFLVDEFKHFKKMSESAAADKKDKKKKKADKKKAKK